MFILQLTVIDVSCGNINGVDAPFSNDLIKPDRSVRCEGEAPPNKYESVCVYFVEQLFRGTPGRGTPVSARPLFGARLKF
jgi:hypothetical protein